MGEPLPVLLDGQVAAGHRDHRAGGRGTATGQVQGLRPAPVPQRVAHGGRRLPVHGHVPQPLEQVLRPRTDVAGRHGGEGPGDHRHVCGHRVGDGGRHGPDRVPVHAPVRRITPQQPRADPLPAPAPPAAPPPPPPPPPPPGPPPRPRPPPAPARGAPPPTTPPPPPPPPPQTPGRKPPQPRRSPSRAAAASGSPPRTR